MISDADRLFLRITYRRLNYLTAAAVTAEQQGQARLARDRATADLRAAGWKLVDIAAAVQVSDTQVQRWSARGEQYIEVARLPGPEPLAPQPVSPADGHLSIQQVASWLQVQAETVFRWVRQGVLPGVRHEPASKFRWTVPIAAIAELGITGPMLTVEDIAAAHGVTTGSVRRWMRANDLPVVRLGRLSRMSADYLPRPG